MKKIFLISTLLFFFSGYQCSSKRPQNPMSLQEVARSERQWTGVAVSMENRIFVNYPRWSDSLTFSVGELLDSVHVKPYPDPEWNRWNSDLSPQDHFICVQSVYIDRDNDLWILDPANPLFHGVVEGGPKLLEVDVQTDQIVRKIYFDSTIAPRNSYLNDVRVDVDRNYAYLTDSGLGAIIVVDLKTGNSRRVLDDHFSTTAEDITFSVEGLELTVKVHSDGIAVSPDGEYLYYQALTGRHLYRIATDYLRDNTIEPDRLGQFVELIGESGVTDGILYGPDDNIYLTSLEYNAIRKINQEGQVEMVVQHEQLKWPDSFAVTPEGTIFVSTSQIHLGPHVSEPFRIFKLVSRN